MTPLIILYSRKFDVSKPCHDRYHWKEHWISSKLYKTVIYLKFVDLKYCILKIFKTGVKINSKNGDCNIEKYLKLVCTNLK